MTIQSRVDDILKLAETGDILHVRSTTFFGCVIRRMLSHGLNRCWGNHNAPVYRDEQGILKMLQIENPAAHEEFLEEYLSYSFKKGYRIILARPDELCHRPHREHIKEGLAYATRKWRLMRGTPYDNTTCRMFARMIFRKGAHLEENDKEEIYCTEGTLDPLVTNPFLKWHPDTLHNENRPAPIHVEHLLRQERLIFIAGDYEGFLKITKGA